jgi:hypothetical protein
MVTLQPMMMQALEQIEHQAHWEKKKLEIIW